VFLGKVGIRESGTVKIETHVSVLWR